MNTDPTDMALLREHEDALEKIAQFTVEYEERIKPLKDRLENVKGQLLGRINERGSDISIKDGGMSFTLRGVNKTRHSIFDRSELNAAVTELCNSGMDGMAVFEARISQSGIKEILEALNIDPEKDTLPGLRMFSKRELAVYRRQIKD